MAVPCPGCGGAFEAMDGPTHRYMTSSPGCWKVFGDLIAAEYSGAAPLEVHRLSVDAYAVQHPGDGSRQAVQSVGLHLARLCVQLHAPRPPHETNAVMQGFSARKATLPLLKPPPRFSMTLADVAPFIGGPHHAEQVRLWAARAYDDWQDQHGVIRDWIGQA